MHILNLSQLPKKLYLCCVVMSLSQLSFMKTVKIQFYCLNKLNIQDTIMVNINRTYKNYFLI